MPLLPTDALWSPLFATAEVTAAPLPGGIDQLLGDDPLGVQLGPSQLRVCWAAPATVRVPLAVPPPWVGTLDITAPAGCRVGDIQTGDGFLSMSIGAIGLVLDARVTLGRKPVWHGHWEHGTPPTSDPLGKLSDGVPEAVFYRTEVAIDDDSLPIGDALPWTRGEQSPDGFSLFMGEVGLDVATLARHTGSGAYAGAALEAMGDLWPELGPTPPRRLRERQALATLDRTRLTQDQQRELTYQLDNLAGAPSRTAPAGRATIEVYPNTLEVEVNGEVVLMREMKAQEAAIAAHHTGTEEVTVAVPPGEAVFVRTMWMDEDAGERVWEAYPSEAWSALLPDGHYTATSHGLDSVIRVGPTCIAVEGCAEGWKAESIGGDQIVGMDEVPWPHQAYIHPTEAGRYTVEFRAEGMERVHFEANACAPAPKM